MPLENPNIILKNFQKSDDDGMMRVMMLRASEGEGHTKKCCEDDKKMRLRMIKRVMRGRLLFWNSRTGLGLEKRVLVNDKKTESGDTFHWNTRIVVCLFF